MGNEMESSGERRTGPRGAAQAGLWADRGIASVEARMRAVSMSDASDNLGLVVVEHLDTGGKRVRARLALAVAEALGLDVEDAVDWAAACELLHNATLIHDDLQDGDRTRRGHPTTWARHGMAQAINAGDLMLMLPFLAVGNSPAAAPVRGLLAQAIAEHAAETVRGQALEPNLPALCRAAVCERLGESAGGGAFDALAQAWRRTALGKTGALIGLPVRGSALLGGWSPEDAAALGRRFAQLGLVFQLQDDVVDLYGDKGRGEVGCDLQEGKVSALVVSHLARAPEDARWLLGVLEAERGVLSRQDVRTVSRRFRESGALAAVLAQMVIETQEVLDDPLLQGFPSLRRVAEALVAVTCQPIAHLMGAAEPPRRGVEPVEMRVPVPA